MTLLLLVLAVMIATPLIVLSSSRLRRLAGSERGPVISSVLFVLAAVAAVAVVVSQVRDAQRLRALEQPTQQAVQVRIQGDLRLCLRDSPAGRECRRSLVELLERGLREREAQKREQRRRSLRREADRLSRLLRAQRLTPRPRRTTSRRARRRSTRGTVRPRQNATRRTTPIRRPPVARRPVPAPAVVKQPARVRRPSVRRAAPPFAPAVPPRDTSRDAERRTVPAPPAPPATPPADPGGPQKHDEPPGESTRRTPPPPT